MIARVDAIHAIERAFSAHQAVGLAGPRQCGKTTLARIVAAKENKITFFDLEKAVDRRRLEAPEQALAPLEGLVIIDEIQRQPGQARPSDAFSTPRKRFAKPDQGGVRVAGRSGGVGGFRAISNPGDRR
jgi:hypothetical protein